MARTHKWLGYILTFVLLATSLASPVSHAMMPEVPATPEVTDQVVETDGDTDTDENEIVAGSVAEEQQPDAAAEEDDPVVDGEPALPTDGDTENNPSTGPPADEDDTEPAVVDADSEESVTEEPAADEQVAEDPVADEPVAEDPVADEPVADEPVADEPVADEPVADEPVADEPVADEPTDKSSSKEIEEPAVETAALVTTQATSGTLSITFMDWNTNAPLAGVQVTITNAGGDITYASGTSNTNGVFEAPMEEGQYYLTATLANYAQDYRDIDVSFSSGSSVHAHEIWLVSERPGTITLTVQDWDTNSDIPNVDVAIVNASDQTVAFGKTEMDGKFVTQELPGGRYYVTVSHPSYHSETFEIDVDGPTMYTRHIIQKVGGDLTVTVLDYDTDAPVANVTVTIDDLSGTFQTGTTNSDGIVIFEDIPAASFHVKTFNVEGYRDGFFSVTVDGDTEVDVWIEKIVAGQVTITALDDSKELPVADAEVIVLLPDQTEVTRGTTNSLGTFNAGELPAGTYGFIITKAGFLPHEVWETNNGGIDATVYLLPKSEGTMTLVIRDWDSDAALEGAVITVTDSDTGKTQTAQTDSTGGADFAALTGTTYFVTVRLDGYADYEMSTTFRGTATMDLHLLKLEPGTLEIIARNKDTDSRMPGVSVEVRQPSDGTLVASGITDANGVYVTPELADGRYSVTASLDGYFTYVTEVEVHGDQSNAVYMERLKPGTMEIYARQMNDLPIPGAAVIVLEVISEPMYGIGELELGDVVASGSTDSIGKYKTPVLTPGRYAIVIEAEGYKPSTALRSFNGDAVYGFSLEADAGTTPTPTPTATPVTPTPTETPVTPTPTETPVTPTPTATPVTPTPTETPVTPTPTETPVTPIPTETPVTPAPTETPVTPAPTETPVTPVPTQTPVTPIPTETPVTPAPTETPVTPVPTQTPVTPAPTEPGQPTDPTTPAPTEPGQPTDPTTPAPTEPGQPTDPTTPAPTEPGQPTDPTTPAPTEPGTEPVDMLTVVTFHLISDDGGSLEGAAFALYAPVAQVNWAGAPFISGTVDATNLIVIENLVPGLYRLTIDAEGYEAIDAVVDLRAATSSEVLVEVSVIAVPAPGQPPADTGKPPADAQSPAPSSTGTSVTTLPTAGSGPAGGTTPAILLVTMGLALVGICLRVPLMKRNRA